jgi:hypothetical protein
MGIPGIHNVYVWNTLIIRIFLKHKKKLFRSFKALKLILLGKQYRYTRKKSYIVKYNITILSQYVYRRWKDEQLCYKVHKVFKFLILIQNIRQFRIKKGKLKMVEHWTLINGKWTICEPFSPYINWAENNKVYIVSRGKNGFGIPEIIWIWIRFLRFSLNS